MQATVLFELAAFAASHTAPGHRISGLQVAEAYMALAAKSAAELEQERNDQTQSGNMEQWELQQREMKAKICMCHYLVVIACGCSAEPGAVGVRSLQPYAQKLCKHILLVCLQLVPAKYAP